MIRLEGVNKGFGAIRIVEGMDLTVEEGESLCLLGRSGCGKSTVLKLMALLDRPDSGRLFIGENDVTKMSDSEVDRLRSEQIAYTFQEPLLIPYVSAVENITMVTGVPKKEAVDMLSRLGLSERLDYHPNKLSGGEKKRVDVARAVLKPSPILIADEPLSNLDPKTGSIVMEILKSRTEKGGILVYSSVEPSEAKVATQVIEMEKK